MTFIKRSLLFLLVILVLLCSACSEPELVEMVDTQSVSESKESSEDNIAKPDKADSTDKAVEMDTHPKADSSKEKENTKKEISDTNQPERPAEDSSSIKNDTTPSKEDHDDIVEVFAGPGEEYVRIASIAKSKIANYIKIEKDWVEIEYNEKRGYIRLDTVKELNTNQIPHVMYSLSTNIYPYPTIYSPQISVTIFDDADVFFSPKYANAHTCLCANSTVLILCNEKSLLKNYLQIEYNTDNGKYRGYCEYIDLFALDNPLLNFNAVKQKNACISFNGTEYYSASGEDILTTGGWKTIEEQTINETTVDYWAGIVAVMAGNDINDEAYDSTQGKIQLFDTSKRQYINANVSNRQATAALSIADFVVESANSFLEAGVKTTSLNIKIQEYNGERRIIIRTGTPFESPRAGKATTLGSLITERDAGNSAAWITSQHEEDEMIKSVYPDLDKSKTYTMQMTFSKDFENNPYGYYIVIDSNYDVYAVPIIHPGTSFLIFSKGECVRDATWDYASGMIKFDDTSREHILNLLAGSGFVVNGYNYNDPNLAQSNDVLEYNGHRYRIFEAVCNTWEEAEAYCESMNGHLAVISSDDENNAIYNFLTNIDYKTAYFGLTDYDGENEWKWVNGEEVDYTNWGTGEPNNEYGHESYAEFYWKYTDGTWNDGDFDKNTDGDSKVFVCEWDE